MKLKILAVVLLAAVGIGAVTSTTGLLTPAATATRYLTTAATSGDVTEDVAATGTLAAQARYGLVFGAASFLVSASASAPTSRTPGRSRRSSSPWATR